MNPDEFSREWDAVVVGAGIAGAVSALHLARFGLRVLLAEKAVWPRAKACGGCLNAPALKALAGSGIEFEDRGEYSLKGVPGPWHLYAVTSDSN